MRAIIALLLCSLLQSCLITGTAALAGATPVNVPGPETIAAADMGDQPGRAECEAALRQNPKLDIAVIGELERGWYRTEPGLSGLRFAWALPVTVRGRNSHDEMTLLPRRYFFVGTTLVARTDASNARQYAVEEWNGGGRTPMQAGLTPAPPKDGRPWTDADGWTHTGKK